MNRPLVHEVHARREMLLDPVKGDVGTRASGANQQAPFDELADRGAHRHACDPEHPAELVVGIEAPAGIRPARHQRKKAPPDLHIQRHGRASVDGARGRVRFAIALGEIDGLYQQGSAGGTAHAGPFGFRPGTPGEIMPAAIRFQCLSHCTRGNIEVPVGSGRGERRRRARPNTIVQLSSLLENIHSMGWCQTPRGVTARGARVPTRLDRPAGGWHWEPCASPHSATIPAFPASRR